MRLRELKMKIEINIPKKWLEHLKNCDSHYDACWTIERIINRIKSEYKKTKSSHNATKEIK